MTVDEFVSDVVATVQRLSALEAAGKLTRAEWQREHTRLNKARGQIDGVARAAAPDLEPLLMLRPWR